MLFDITVFRPKMEAVSPRRKSMRIVFMADRIRSGEFNGSVRLAARSPITLSMGISIDAIEHQLRKVDPAAFAARLEDRARVKAEAAAAEASGKNVEFFFVERGGSSSAKRALGKLEKRLKGNAVWVRNKLV